MPSVESISTELLTEETPPAVVAGRFEKNYQSGNVVRLDVPTPFFLRNHVFSNFSKPTYSWDNEDIPSSGAKKEMMVVFVYNQEGQGGVRSEFAVAKKKNSVEYSIGGCPLECPFDLNEDFDEALVIESLPLVFDGIRIPWNYFPFKLDDGRWAIRQVSIQDEPFVKEVNLENEGEGWHAEDTPVLAFVDCADQGSGLTLTGFRRPFSSINVHQMGRHKPEAKILEMKAFRKYHDDNLLVENKPMTTMAHAIYEKLHGEFPSKGKVYLEFMFKDPVNMFDLPPEDALSKIAISPLPGDANPSMHALWEEIEDLERWLSILAECSSSTAGADVTSFLNSTVYELNEATASENLKAVHALLEKEPAIDLHHASATEFSDALDSVLQRTVEQKRADCDFTDRLWSVLRKCETVDELQECLHLVFQAVANKMYRPYLLLSNSTSMSKSLSMVMKGEMASLLQIRRHEIMVKMVIECGMVKLFKDYNFSLAMSHLIERGEVDSFAPTMSDISVSLWNLKKLHCILEVMCLSKERLTLSVNVQDLHVKKMLRMFSERSSVNWEQTYHFDVSSNDIRRVMTGLHPIYYKVKMESHTFLKWAKTTIVVSPEDYICYKKSASDDANSRQYYVYVICESGRLEN